METPQALAVLPPSGILVS